MPVPELRELNCDKTLQNVYGFDLVMEISHQN